MDERAVWFATALVNPARQGLLADANFSLNEDRDAAGGRLLCAVLRISRICGLAAIRFIGGGAPTWATSDGFEWAARLSDLTESA